MSDWTLGSTLSRFSGSDVLGNFGRSVVSGSGRVVDRGQDIFNWAKDAAESMSGVTANEIATQNLEYQKEYNQQIFDREDTAYQRLVKDLTAAGLNPAFGVQKSSGAGAGGTTSAPKMTYRSEDPTRPLQALLNIRKMFGDLDEQEARVNNLNVAAATNQALADSEINYKAHMLDKMGIESDFIKSQTILNETRNENEKKKILSDLEVAKTVMAKNESERKHIDAATQIAVDRADDSLKLLKAQVKEAEINNTYLTEVMDVSLDLSKAELEKMNADRDLALQKFEHLSRVQQLEIAERYYNLLYAASNNVSIGTNPVDKTGATFGLGLPGVGEAKLGIDTSKTGGRSVGLNDFIKELAPRLISF